jgi:hypothetical protein
MSNPVVGAVVDCTVLSSTFPSSIHPEIPRDAILNLIDDFFSCGIHLVSLEGKPDVGKTRILAQFAMRHSTNAISVFVKPNSWFVQDPGLLYADIARQMNWALTRSELQSPHSADETMIRHISFDLQSTARRNGATYYFLIDGMEDLSESAAHFANTLLRILPVEYSAFRFLTSGEAKWLPSQSLSPMVRKSYPVSGFSLEETTSFFDGFQIERRDIEELYNSCSKGTPGHLASARRLIEGGMAVSTLIEELPQKLPNPFQLEWRTVVAGDENLTDMLAILCYDSFPHSVSELATLVGLPIENVREQLSSCGFLNVPEDGSLPVEYVSASFRGFVAQQLMTRREVIWEKLAQHFLDDQESDRARAVLPSYLDKAGRVNEVLAVLNTDTFVRLAERTDSFIPIQRESELGLSTAIRLKRPAEAVRFGLQIGAVGDVSPSSFRRAEVNAQMAVGNYDAALSLAQSAALKHQRLQLLAAITKFQAEKGLTSPATVIESIETLVGQINIKELGDDVVELAADLMYTRPDLAIKVISQHNPNTSDERAMDWALVRLSVLRPFHQSRKSLLPCRPFDKPKYRDFIKHTC